MYMEGTPLKLVSVSECDHTTTHYCSATLYTVPHLDINSCKLPPPGCVVEEGSEVKPIVIRTIGLSVIGRSECGKLVPVE